jgi:hypothetical protein
LFVLVDVTFSSYFEILFYYSQKLVADQKKKKKKKRKERWTCRRRRKKEKEKEKEKEKKKKKVLFCSSKFSKLPYSF